MSDQLCVNRDNSGGELFHPFAAIDEGELREASMLFKYFPTNDQLLEVNLYAKPHLWTIDGGGVRLGYDFEIVCIDRAGAKGAGSKRIGSNVAIDADLINAALAIGGNPIVEILIAQKSLAADLYEGVPALQAAITAIELARSTPPGEPAPRSDFRL